MLPFAKSALLACGAILAAAHVSSLAAQRAPWARTHVFAGVEASHDDQPLDVLRPTIATWGFLTDWTSVGARVASSFFRIGGGGSASMKSASVTLGQSVFGGRLSFDGDAGLLERSWGRYNQSIGSATISARPATWATLSARAERFAYTSTIASLSQYVMPDRFTVDANVATPSGWMGQAEWQDTQFDDMSQFPQGTNHVTSAFAWALAPVMNAASQRVQLGYSIATQNSTRLEYTVRSQNVSVTSPNFDLSGIYSPYYTPRNVVVHSAVIAVTVGDEQHVVFRANGAYGFHAMQDAPTIVKASPAPRGVTLDIVESNRSYAPWNVRASITSAVSRSASLNVGAEMMHTAFYTAETATVSLDYTIGK